MNVSISMCVCVFVGVLYMQSNLSYSDQIIYCIAVLSPGNTVQMIKTSSNNENRPKQSSPEMASAYSNPLVKLVNITLD